MTDVILASALGESGMSTAASTLVTTNSPLEAVQAGIMEVEKGGLPFVGYGGDTNLIGRHEFDAGIMDGSTLRAASVGALEGFVHPIWVARQIMERSPHVMIVGPGARLFAAEVGATPASSGQDGAEAQAKYRRWVKETVPESLIERWPDVPLTGFAWPNPDLKSKKDTVVFLAMNGAEIAAGTSTSGWPFKYPGRLGDSPICGAGFYADATAGACACTHTGEMTMRTLTAFAVVSAMRKGASIDDACAEAIEDLRRIKAGYLGHVVIHAIDKTGTPHVVATTKETGPCWIWTRDSGQVKRFHPIVDEISFD